MKKLLSLMLAIFVFFAGCAERESTPVPVIVSVDEDESLTVSEVVSSEAREKGQVPQSQELASVATLAVLVMMLALLAPGLMQWFFMQMKRGMLCEIGIFSDRGAFVNFVNTKIVDSMLIIWPIFAALFVGVILAGIAVGGNVCKFGFGFNIYSRCTA